mmetsp:Transcript_74063/g.66646  ORF Transcript_74063/g.66646 Transcript_74063/m.66646 type:complete len:247 (+) Transcript_74063:73-813(+)
MAAEKETVDDSKSNDNDDNINIIKDEKTGILIEEFQKNVLLVRGILSIEQQLKLYEEMIGEEKIMVDRLKKYRGDNYKPPIKDGLISMYTKQKMGGDLLEDEGIKDSIYDILLKKGMEIVEINYKLKDITLKDAKLGHIQAAKYKTEEGKLKNHVDGIFHGPNAVFLFSIGCNANFYVKGPEMKKEKIFKFKSGDCLFFDATNKAKILHGIESIDPGQTCPKQLKEKFESAGEYRIGLQMRAYYPK